MPPIPSTYSRRKEHIFNEDNVELKHCGKCDSWKILSEFNNCKSTWDGLRGDCKSCVKASKKTLNDACGYYTNYAKSNWQKVKDSEERKEKKREYRADNIDKLTANFKIWYENNKDEHNKKTYQARKDDPRRIEYMKQYRPIYEKERRVNDPQFKLKTNYARRVREMLNTVNASGKVKSSKKYLGCDIEFFRNYLEAQFTDNMSWDNQGEWHLDHIIPCASFDMTNEFEIFACFNYRNYQPLMGAENIAKSNKYTQSDREKYLSIMRPIYDTECKK